jgi:hypothetical protein
MCKYIILFLLFSLPIISHADESELVNDLFGNAWMNHKDSAKFFNFKLIKETSSGYTDVICVDKHGDDAVHLSFYSDGYIIIWLSGGNEGKQIVLYKGKIIGSALYRSTRGRYSVHTYSWGTVYTNYNKQEVEFNSEIDLLIECLNPH